MEWTNIIPITSISAVVIAAVVYFLKKGFESLLNTKLNELEEKNKAYINEALRRKATIFDQQFVTLKAALSLVYRSRNTARDIKDMYYSNNKKDVKSESLILQFNAIKELLFNEIAILPDEIYKLLHEQRNRIDFFIKTLEINDNSAEFKKRLEETLFILDVGYHEIDKAIKEFLEINIYE